MTINRETVEQIAEASAQRVLVQTMAVLVFGQSGLSAERVRALGRSLSDQITDVVIPGADAADAVAIREANARAVEALFEGVAEAMPTDS